MVLRIGAVILDSLLEQYGPVADQIDGRYCLADPGVDQKALAVGRDGVVAPVWVACKWHVDVEERLGRCGAERVPAGNRDAHERAARREIEQLVSVAAPPRFRSAVRRNLALLAGRRKRLDPYLHLS